MSDDWSEIVDPIFGTYILGNAPPKKIGEGFDWLEGPVWFGDANCLLFSDIPSSRVMRWIPDEGITTYMKPSNYANGHTRDREGRLLSCQHGGRNVTRTEYDGSITIIADQYDGLKLNSPNEVIVKSDGTIWFSDPYYGIQTNYEGFKATPELPCNLYRYTPSTGNLEVMIEGWFDGDVGRRRSPPKINNANVDIKCPNGLAFSPNEDKLYVADTGRMFNDEDPKAIYVYDCAPDGTLSNQELFYVASVGISDGFRVDTDGNIWTSSGEGVHCVSPTGDLLGKILIPETVSNVAFGGRDRFQLFMTASTSLYMISLNREGATWPDTANSQSSDRSAVMRGARHGRCG